MINNIVTLSYALVDIFFKYINTYTLKVSYTLDKTLCVQKMHIFRTNRCLRMMFIS